MFSVETKAQLLRAAARFFWWIYSMRRSKEEKYDGSAHAIQTTTGRKEFHVENEVIHFLSASLALLIVPAEVELLNVVLLDGICSFNDTTNGFEPFFLAAVDCSGVGSSVDGLTEAVETEGCLFVSVLFNELIVECE